MPGKPSYEELEQMVQRLERVIDEGNHLETGKVLQSLVQSPESFNIFYLDTAYRYLFFNKVHKAAVLDAWDSEIELGTNLLDYISVKEDRNEALRNFDRALAGETFTRVQGFGNTEKRVWESIYSPMVGLGGQIKGLSVYSIDITKHRKSEAKRHAAEVELKSTVDILPIIVSKANLHTGYFTKSNQWVTKVLGFSIEEFTSKPFIKFLHPEDVQRTRNEVTEQLKGKEVAFFENRYLCKDGSYKWIAWQGTPADENGIVTAIGLDINERKLAEAALMQSEFRYRTLVNTIPDLIWLKDLNGVFLNCNRMFERFFGAKESEIVGKTDYDFVDKTLADFFRANDQKAIVAGCPSVNEEKLTFANNGYSGMFETLKTPMRDNDGNLIGVLGIARDISERQRAAEERLLLERQLKQSQKMESIGNLAGGIAHDFNNILSSVIGFTELALDEVGKETTLEDNLQEVYAAGKRAKVLVKQILAFARQSDEKREPIRVNVLINEVLRFIRSSIPTTIEIRHTIESESFIMGNTTQVHQVLMNLCTNAAHAMNDKGGILEVHSKDVRIDSGTIVHSTGLSPGDYIEIKVSDTGVGISPEVLESIFEPYFTTKAPGEGTGMGLAVAHGIVESYGGKIHKESTLGEGTVISVYLPVFIEEKALRTPSSAPILYGTERILLVDDEASIANMGGQILERLGYSVETRTNSVEALELFRSKPNDFDLVITDMTMPNMTGDSLAIALLKLRSDIPVILWTGYSNKISDEKAAKIGIKAFVYKPIIKNDLAKIIRKVLDETKDSIQG